MCRWGESEGMVGGPAAEGKRDGTSWKGSEATPEGAARQAGDQQPLPWSTRASAPHRGFKQRGRCDFSFIKDPPDSCVGNKNKIGKRKIKDLNDLRIS